MKQIATKKALNPATDFIVHEYLCNMRGCIALATHAPKIMMPVAGDKHKPVPMIAEVRFCYHHCRSVKPFDIMLRKDVETFVSRVCNAKGLLRPDWDRAYVVAVELESLEYSDFLAIRMMQQ